MAGNAILAVAEHPQRDKPLIQAERRVFKEAVYLDAELLAARIALPALLSGQPIVLALALFDAAFRAYWDAIRPAESRDRINADLFVAVVTNCFGKCLWNVHELIP